ncbi:MAG: NAD(P)-dependent oxidoreductase [Alphaproteobacteria bacterium]
MRLFLTGATGNSGQAIARMAVEKGHEVTAFVRSAAKLEGLLGADLCARLSVVEGDVTDIKALTDAMRGHEAVINAAGNANDGDSYVPLVKGVITAAAEALGQGGRFVMFGGAAALNVPGQDITGINLPRIPAVFKQHEHTIKAVRATDLDWSMMCPGPMVDGPLHDGLRVSADIWPVDGPKVTFPKIAMSLAFLRKMPEMIVSYTDVAQVVLDHLDKGGPYACARVGVALPEGMKGKKDF